MLSVQHRARICRAGPCACFHHRACVCVTCMFAAQAIVRVSTVHLQCRAFCMLAPSICSSGLCVCVSLLCRAARAFCTRCAAAAARCPTAGPCSQPGAVFGALLQRWLQAGAGIPSQLGFPRESRGPLQGRPWHLPSASAVGGWPRGRACLVLAVLCYRAVGLCGGRGVPMEPSPTDGALVGVHHCVPPHAGLGSVH